MALSVGQMTRMSRLLDEVLSLDRPERLTWLARLPPEDADLKEVLGEALLAGTQQLGAGGVDFDAHPRLHAMRQPAFGNLAAGDSLGPYRLIRPIGSGGMAEVWLAKAVDRSIERTLAIKLPLSPYARGDLAQRFARERDILATLDHPFIARLYDAGVSAQGIPYLALEYVQGQPITRWCDEQVLPVRRRLALFLQVLEALEFAHRRGVIHRDLKPSNILVSDFGQVKLLDFGIAKILNVQAGGDASLVTTQFGPALTPGYASPEQIRGDAVDEATDVYALGLVLYEMLTGQVAYALPERLSPAELERVITQSKVRPPSSVVTAEHAARFGVAEPELAALLRGDLDRILLHALAKRKSDRTFSVAELGRQIKLVLDTMRQTDRSAHVTRAWWRLRYRYGRVTAMAKTAVAQVPVRVLSLCFWALLPLSSDALHVASAEHSDARGSVSLASMAQTVSPSIAVLPFADESDNHDQEYFSDGFTDALITDLTKATNLKVSGRASSFYFKTRHETSMAIAHRLGAELVLEGSIRNSGGTVRVSSRLVRGSNGQPVWSQTLERRANEVQLLRQDLVSEVAGRLGVASEPTPASDQPDLETYNLFLQGNFFRARSETRDNFAAIELYKSALRRSPGFAPAWENLAGTYVMQGLYDLPPADVEGKAREAVTRALSLNPKSATAHMLLGHVLRYFDFDISGASAQYKQAQDLGSGSLDAINDPRIAWLTLEAMRSGQLRPLIDYELSLLSRNPLDTWLLVDLGTNQFNAGDLDASVVTFNRILELNANYSGAHTWYAATLLRKGEYARAYEETKKEPGEFNRCWITTLVLWKLGHHREARSSLKTLIAKFGKDNPASVADAYALMGQRSIALNWLERALHVHDAYVLSARFNPFLSDLHGETRFQSLLNQLDG
jgi:serine/threonine protein kinase/Tfp pilus assembly protein PilF